MRSPIIIPPDTDMHPASGWEILRYEYGTDVVLAMRALNFGMYYNYDGHYWIGSRNTGFPHNDRWLYRINRQQLEAVESWGDVRVDIPRNCCKESAHETMEAGLVDVLEQLATRFQNALDRMGQLSTQEKTRLTDNYLLGLQAFDYVLDADIDGVLCARWDQESHDLLRHYDTWAARQVAEPLPREVALRLYGFGAYIDAINVGNDWLI